MADATYTHDVFLSYSSKDREIVRPLAERLRSDNLRVWFAEWEIRPGDSIQSKIEEGLEHSRILVLCMSANAFDSGWTRLESGTFRFRDPLNKDRRFIPLRLDEAPLKGSLAQFLYIDWTQKDRGQHYPKLLEACRLAEKPAAEAQAERQPITSQSIHLKVSGGFPACAFSPDGKRLLSGSADKTVRLWDVESGSCLRVLEGHTDTVYAVAWSDDRRHALSGSNDDTVRLWDVESGSCLRVLEGHTDSVYAVAWSDDRRHALSGSDDKTVRLWDVESGSCLRVLEGHTGPVYAVAWSDDRRHALSGSHDDTVRLWDVESGSCLRVLEGHTDSVYAVAWSDDRRHALSGSHDKTVRLWDVESGSCLRVLEGHTNSVIAVAWSDDRRHALSGSHDDTVRLWDVESGSCLRVLEGHTDSVIAVAWSDDRRHALSVDNSGGIRVWDLSDILADARGLAADQVQYTNAKVLLVGDSGVGKTGLANYLALGLKDEGRNASTDGAWATHWPIRHDLNEDGVDREIWLWDFAGQVDYRLVHQLFMDDTAAAVLVFNPQHENPYEGLGQWDHDLQRAARKPFAKLLAAGRIDRGGLVVSAASMERFMTERGFRGLLHETSAKTGDGCDKLREAIVEAIDWQGIPKTTSPVLYHRMKQEILRLRDSGLVLIRMSELKQRMEMALAGESFTLEELLTVVGLLAGPGMIQRVDFGGFILLRPEVLSRYAAAVVRKVRKHPQELGCIREDEMLAGDLDYQDFERLPADDESVVLRILHETFVGRAWCLRQPYDSTNMLTFPSYFRRERPELQTHPTVLVTYRFTGLADEIYATLVVQLHHTVGLETDQLWKSAADFKTATGQSLGLKLVHEGEGISRLEIYFNPGVDENTRVVFLLYVHNHLVSRALNVKRLRHYSCGNKKCESYNQLFTDQSKIDKAQAHGGKGKVFCPECGRAIILRDPMEKRFDSFDAKQEANWMKSEGQAVIAREKNELIFKNHVFAITNEAGQMYRSYTTSDHGINGEIEFRDDEGRPTGKGAYLHFLSNDANQFTNQNSIGLILRIYDLHSDLYRRHFMEASWVNYWRQQAWLMMLAIRRPDGGIFWMEVSSHLKQDTSNKSRNVFEIAFKGESFDVMSVQRWCKFALKKDLF